MAPPETPARYQAQQRRFRMIPAMTSAVPTRAPGSDFAELSNMRSYGYVLRHLHAVGAPLRAARR
jgi:hypothetical protein